MKIVNCEDERVHILDSQTSVWSVIEQIANSGFQEDAFYICDLGDIVRKHRLWKAILPRVEPFYAVKCNDSLAILELLAALGTGFDCASKSEINKILDLGVDPEKIIFANPAKPSSHIRYAAAMNVQLMTFDCETELHKIKNLYPDSKMVIRIRCDAIDAQCQLGMKFGCDPINEAPELLRIARSMGIDVVGVSFHVGSGCRESNVFHRAIVECRKIFDYASKLGYNFNLLDLGGGYPGGNNTNLNEIANIINNALNEYFPEENIKIIAEPGRYYVQSAYTLACNIHSMRDVIQENPLTGDVNIHKMYFINDGVYGSFNCILYDHQHVIPQLLTNKSPSSTTTTTTPTKTTPPIKYYSSSIWGPTCDGLDQVVDDILLPELKLGDWLIFEDMGAYTLPVASAFNGFPIPKVHIVCNDSVWDCLKDILQLTDDHFTIGKHHKINFNNDQLNDIQLTSLTIDNGQLSYFENATTIIGDNVLDFIN